MANSAEKHSHGGHRERMRERFLVAGGNACLSDCHEAHTDILDDVARGQGKSAHFLGVDLL